tara:strand:+ start:6267 stop:6443 length:177 start_codon:yes stop_codon:yes gene_type:complete
MKTKRGKPKTPQYRKTRTGVYEKDEPSFKRDYMPDTTKPLNRRERRYAKSVEVANAKR